jgi:hypothetical protein
MTHRYLIALYNPEVGYFETVHRITTALDAETLLALAIATPDAQGVSRPPTLIEVHGDEREREGVYLIVSLDRKTTGFQRTYRKIKGEDT